MSVLRRLVYWRFTEFFECLLPLRLQTELPTQGPLWGWDVEVQSAFLLAVPKKRTSHSKKRMRHAHKYLKNITHIERCKCGKEVPKLSHVLCSICVKDIMQKTAEIRRDGWRS
jgi:large subunit ribosomal protein L32